jgi:hypothetical protein
VIASEGCGGVESVVDTVRAEAELATMSSYEGVGDGEAEAGSWSRPRVLSTVEALRGMGEEVGG